MDDWLNRLVDEAKQVVRHGQGKISLDVGPYSTDKTSVLIVAGKGYKFIVDRIKNIED